MRWIVVIAAIATIATNALVEALPLNGLRTGAISDQFQVYFTPAGYVFTIWSLIFAGLIAYSGHQWLQRPPHARLRAIEWPFLWSCACNIVWLIVWHYVLYTTSLVVMLALLISLLFIYFRLRTSEPVGVLQRWLVDRVFSLYTGWVTVATLANLTIVLDANQARPFGWDALPWALAMMAIATVIGVIVITRLRDLVFAGVIVWAAIGIGVRPGQPLVMQQAAWAGVAVLVIAALVIWILRGRIGTANVARA